MKLSIKLTVTVASLSLGTAAASAIAVHAVLTTDALPLWLAPVIVLAIALLVTLLAAILFIRQITVPIAALSAAITRVALGDLSQEVKVQSKDELGKLTQNFNNMILQLTKAYRSLEETVREAKQGRAQLEASINSLHQAFILVNAKDEVLMANAVALSTIFGEQKSAEKNAASRTPTLDEVAQALAETIDIKKIAKQTLLNLKPSKFSNLPLGGRFLNVYLSPVISEETAIGYVILIEDVTEERILQRSRDEFFSIASHELRTPLTAIRGSTSMIKDYFPKEMKNEDLSSIVDDMHESAVRLIEIVNDFLDTSSLEQGKVQFHFTAFKLESIIEKIIYELSGMGRNKNIALQFDHLTLKNIGLVYADPSRLEQILYNLIGNAMKFTDKGSVTINCIVEAKQVKVCVSDTGQGISLEGQQILFHKFQQSTKSILTRDSTRGTGLGLYISKLLIEQMGGVIKLEHTEEGKGSTFSITIPFATPAQIKLSAADPEKDTVLAESSKPRLT